MKLPRTVGLAIAVSLQAAAVAALAQISGAASTSPTANVRQADRAPHEATHASAAQRGTPRTWMITRLCRDKKVDRNPDDQ
jgi:hypothetical protein